MQNIDALDAKLHAFIEVYREDAMRMAEAADLERKARFVRGPLHGLPIAIKDLFHIKGRQTTAGSKSWLGRISTETAVCVQRLLDAGMIPLGKTHLVEFAYGTWGTNKPMGTPWNPWDMKVHRVAGGSSSGSAVAVAAGMAPAALGTDTGGSVRIPAALCGLVGLKPTYGRIPLDGVVPLSKTLDSVGPITRTVEDAALLVAVMAGEPLPVFDEAASIEGMRITALSREQFPDFIEPDIVKAYDETIAQLRELGARVVEERIPFDFAALGAKNGRIIGIEGYAVQREYVDDENADVDPGVRQRMLIGKNIERGRVLRCAIAAKDGDGGIRAVDARSGCASHADAADHRKAGRRGRRNDISAGDLVARHQLPRALRLVRPCRHFATGFTNRGAVDRLDASR